MRFFYTLGIHLYTLAIRIAALFGHGKARLMVQGWRQWRTAATHLRADRPVAWFHASSLGEFEQARPVLEAYRLQHPDHQIAVSFFSPSGYEVRKNYPLADAIFYLPPDTPRNARHLASVLHPDIVFFVKYDFWFNLLDVMRRRSVPAYLFSSIFRPQQYFFQWYGGWFRRQLRDCFTHIFVQNTESLQLLRSHGIDRCTLAGDTRFDRVHQIALAAEGDAVVEAFLGGRDGEAPSGQNVLVAGSTWPPDEQIISSILPHHPSLKVVLAPHVISEEHLKQIEALLPDSVRYSALKERRDLDNAKVLIIDNIGLLSKLYRYADAAYIGGGFGVGIHNILEAVTFGKPVFFGPNYHKFQEAKDIIDRGGGWSIGMPKGDPAATFHSLFSNLLAHPEALQNASKACLDYMNANLGSTDFILRKIVK